MCETQRGAAAQAARICGWRAAAFRWHRQWRTKNRASPRDIDMEISKWMRSPRRPDVAAEIKARDSS